MNTIPLTVIVTGKPTLIDFKFCPFCGSEHLETISTSTDNGNYEVIECTECLGSAPADKWNNRSTNNPGEPT